MKKSGGLDQPVPPRRILLKHLPVFAGAVLLISLTCDVPFGFAKAIYPADKIRWVVPYQAGGGLDLVTRGISQYLAKYLVEVSPGAKGGGVIIRNEPGGGSIKGYSLVYNAAPDGYTIGSFDMAFATESLMSQKLDFDMRKFTYLLRIHTTTRVLVVPKAGFASWDEMIKSARTKELKWGTGAFGRALTVDSIIVKERVGIPARFIPWNGTAGLMNALIRGDVQVALVSADSAKALLDAGEVRLLTEFVEKCDRPGVPSIKELGYPDLVEKLGAHRYVIAPPALPKAIGNTLIAAFKKVFNDKEFQAWASKSDITLSPLYGEQAETTGQRKLRYYQEDLKPILAKYLR